jgi:hypothetical protein
MAPAIQLHVGISGEFGPEDVRDAFADAFPGADLEADGDRSLLVTIEDTPVAWSEIEAAYDGARLQIERDHIQEEIEEGDVPIADQAEVARKLSDMALHGWVSAVDGSGTETLVVRLRLGSGVSESRAQETVSRAVSDEGSSVHGLFRDVSVADDGTTVVLRDHIGGRVTYEALQNILDRLADDEGGLDAESVTLDVETTDDFELAPGAAESLRSTGGSGGGSFADAIEELEGIDTAWNAFGREGSYTRESAREQLEDWREEYGAEAVVAALDGRNKLPEIPQNGIEKMVAQFSGVELESILTD